LYLGSACRTTETVSGKFLKAKSCILAFAGQTAGYQLSGTEYIFLQATVRALKKVSVPRENTQGTGLFLQGSHLSCKPAKIVQRPTHVRLVVTPLV